MNKNIKTAIIIGGIIVAILIIIPLLSILIGGEQDYSYGMMSPWMMGNIGWAWFMPLLMLIFWGLVIWGIVALIRGVASSSHTGPSNQAESALDVLKKRYARGEISKEEYEEKKKDLV